MAKILALHLKGLLDKIISLFKEHFHWIVENTIVAQRLHTRFENIKGKKD